MGRKRSARQRAAGGAGPDFSSPCLWDFWRGFFETREIDLTDLCAARATCRAFRAIVDDHSHVLWRAGSRAIDLFVNERNRHPLMRRIFTVHHWSRAEIHLPPNVTSLSYDVHKRRTHGMLTKLIPRTVRVLHLVCPADERAGISCLPPLLEVLHLDWPSGLMVSTCLLPSRLTHLVLAGEFNSTIFAQNLPRTLVCLEFGEWYDEPLREEHLPRTLKRLVFGKRFNQLILVGDLPVGLLVLAFGVCFRTPFDVAALPRGLRRLVLGPKCREWVKPTDIPPFSAVVDADAYVGPPPTIADRVQSPSRRWKRLRSGLDPQHDASACGFPLRCAVTFAHE